MVWVGKPVAVCAQLLEFSPPAAVSGLFLQQSLVLSPMSWGTALSGLGSGVAGAVTSGSWDVPTLCMSCRGLQEGSPSLQGGFEACWGLRSEGSQVKLGSSMDPASPAAVSAAWGVLDTQGCDGGDVPRVLWRAQSLPCSACSEHSR